MIPKIIHYCWFGRNPKPELAEKCIASWKKYLPEYDYIEWNEDNFPLDRFPYAKQALETKKYAYITDVVRLYALKEFGGIYMDTDVEVLKPLDIFLTEVAFSGFENNHQLPTGIIGAEKQSKWATDMLAYYDGRDFLDEKGNPILTTNVLTISMLMKKEGFQLDNTFQKKEDYITFYPSEYFCPKDYNTGKIEITKNTYCIHHFSGSWQPHKQKIKIALVRILYNILGKELMNKLVIFKSKIKR